MVDWPIGEAGLSFIRKRAAGKAAPVSEPSTELLELDVYKTLSAAERENALSTALKTIAAVENPGRLLNSYVEHAARRISRQKETASLRPSNVSGHAFTGDDKL